MEAFLTGQEDFASNRYLLKIFQMEAKEPKKQTNKSQELCMPRRGGGGGGGRGGKETLLWSGSYKNKSNKHNYHTV